MTTTVPNPLPTTPDQVSPAQAAAAIAALVQAAQVDLVGLGFHQLDVWVSNPFASLAGPSVVDLTKIWLQVDVWLDVVVGQRTVTNDVDQGRVVTLRRPVGKTIYMRADQPPSALAARVHSAVALLPNMAAGLALPGVAPAAPNDAGHAAIDDIPILETPFVGQLRKENR